MALSKSEDLDKVSHKGTSRKALSMENSAALNAEKFQEFVTSTMRAVMNDGDQTPYIVGIKNGQPLIQKLEQDEEGNFVIPKIREFSKQELKKKSKLVNRIVDKIAPTLVMDIQKVTFIALMRKDENALLECLQALEINKDTPVKLENRVGCIYLVIGEEEFLI